MTRSLQRFVLLAQAVSLLLYSGCREPEIPKSTYLSRSLKGKIWKQAFEPTLQLSLRLRFEKHVPDLHIDPRLVAFYSHRNYQPVLLESFLENHHFDSLLTYLSHASEHGLSSKKYNTAELARLNLLIHSGKISNRIDACVALSSLELRAASLLATYSHDLRYGVLEPGKLYKSRFSLKLLRPDSAFYDSVLSTRNLVNELHELQPRNPMYLEMKDSLASLLKQPGTRDDIFSKAKVAKLRINMERLRWRHADTSRSFALVNIPSFKLYAFENDSIVWSMGVCVGERKGADFDEKYKKYLSSGNIDDRPQNHQTPILNSQFRSIQLNPKWNIPTSIMENELYYKLRKDPNYLAEKNMKLYKGSREVGRLDTIQWDKIPRGKIPFHVKQDAGEYNALGKIKFSFDNPFSVYLHDTPTRSPFRRPVRDVSHGCVRLEYPMKLASWLSRYNGKYSYDMIRIGVGMKPEDSSARMQRLFDRHAEELSKNGNHLSTTSVTLKKRTPIYIEYYTCWKEPGKGLLYLNDIYRLDLVLLKNLPD